MPYKYKSTAFILNTSGRFLSMLLLISAAIGCIRDGEIDCVGKALLYVSTAESQSRASTPSGDEPAGVDGATVYIFDPQSGLERTVTLSREDIENRVPVEITIDNSRLPQVVVWGNLNGSQEVSDSIPGLSLSAARVSTIEADGYTVSPDKLYYGLRELTDDDVQEVVITPWVARVYITVHGLEDAPEKGANCHFTIESEYNSYDFYGEPQAGKVMMRVDSEYLAHQEEDLLVYHPVNLIAYPVVSGHRQSMIVSMYRRTDAGDILLASVERDIEGNRIVAHPGENANVLLDFTDPTQVQVHLELTPWEWIHQWFVR